MYKIILIVLLFSLASCSTIGSSRKITNTNYKNLEVSNLNLRIYSTDLSINNKDNRKLVTKVKSALYTRIISENITQNVKIVEKNINGEFGLDVNLIEIEEVSDSARFMLGVFAGRNRIKAIVKLSNVSGVILEEFVVEGASASHPFSGKIGFEDAARELSSRIVKELKY